MNNVVLIPEHGCSNWHCKYESGKFGSLNVFRRRCEDVKSSLRDPAWWHYVGSFCTTQDLALLEPWSWADWEGLTSCSSFHKRLKYTKETANLSNHNGVGEDEEEYYNLIQDTLFVASAYLRDQINVKVVW